MIKKINSFPIIMHGYDLLTGYTYYMIVGSLGSPGWILYKKKSFAIHMEILFKEIPVIENYDAVQEMIKNAEEYHNKKKKGV